MTHAPKAYSSDPCWLPPKLLESDEEVRKDRHREGGEGRSDRARPDLRFRYGQTLTHDLDFPPLAGEIKFLDRGSDCGNFLC